MVCLLYLFGSPSQRPFESEENFADRFTDPTMYNRTESYGPRALQRWILMQFGEELVVCCVLCLIVHCADLALVGGGYRHRGRSSLSELVLLHTA